MGIVAQCLDWNAEDEVLVGRGDFVAHAATWMPLADAGRLRLKTVAPRGRFITAEDFVAQIGPRTRLVSTSLVRPYDGILLDAAKLSEACREVGAFLLLDVSQCVGVMPLDLSTLGADFVVSSGYKWLLGPYGTGFFWVRTEALSQMRAAPVYWKMLEGAHDVQRFSTERIKAKPGACRWDSAETSSFFNLAPLACSLELLLKVEVRTIWEHNRRLVSRLVERLPSEHCVLTSPTDPNIIGPYACFSTRAHETTKALYEKLRAERIFISLRDGALRVAPHLYNAEADIDRLLLSVRA
jgi:selenocysteine lyase/cysteine desulfurase